MPSTLKRTVCVARFLVKINFKGTNHLTNAVLRGGSWNNKPRNLRVSNRNNNTPDDRNNNVGIRVAQSA
jgi:formylglycine-generating enzyme required for sulfatase activity